MDRHRRAAGACTITSPRNYGNPSPTNSDSSPTNFENLQLPLAASYATIAGMIGSDFHIKSLPIDVRRTRHNARLNSA